MHDIKEIPAWDRMLKEIVWTQIGDISGLHILDFGSGQGITADHLAEKNMVVAIEPWDEMLKERWTDHLYEQINGDVSKLKDYDDGSFDLIICHNVLEYINNKE